MSLLTTGDGRIARLRVGDDNVGLFLSRWQKVARFAVVVHVDGHTYDRREAQALGLAIVFAEGRERFYLGLCPTELDRCSREVGARR